MKILICLLVCLPSLVFGWSISNMTSIPVDMAFGEAKGIINTNFALLDREAFTSNNIDNHIQLYSGDLNPSDIYCNGIDASAIVAVLITVSNLVADAANIADLKINGTNFLTYIGNIGTTGSTGTFGVIMLNGTNLETRLVQAGNTNWVISNFYAISNPSNYITTNLTASLYYPISNPSNYQDEVQVSNIVAGSISTNYLLPSQVGSLDGAVTVTNAAGAGLLLQAISATEAAWFENTNLVAVGETDPLSLHVNGDNEAAADVGFGGFSVTNISTIIFTNGISLSVESSTLLIGE